VLAALVSLRVFKAEFDFDGENITDGYLQFIKELSERAQKLEYVGVFDYGHGGLHGGKRVSGEWVRCDEAEFNEVWTDPPNYS
jgi:hypothetical protein